MPIINDLNKYNNWVSQILNGTMFSNIVKAVGGGYTKDSIKNALTLFKVYPTKENNFVLYNDLTLRGCVELSNFGFKNFYLLLDIRDKFIEDYFFNLVYKSKKFYELFPNGLPFKGIIKYNSNGFFEKFEGDCMKYLDNPYIISNPAYGKTGDIITYDIAIGLKRKEFVNLLPLKDYSLKTGQWIDFSSITTFPPHSFPGADILTHAVRILDKPDISIKTEDDLCAAAFTVDKPMIKFMQDNLKKKHYAFDNIKMWTPGIPVAKSFIYQLLRTQSQHTCGMDQLETKSVANEYNFNNKVIIEKTSEIKNTICTVAGNSNYKVFIFNTEIEKQRLNKLYPLIRNFINRMIANQFISIRDDKACWPKIDLTNDKWDSINTEEEAITEIMREVNNSTDAEIKAVLDTMNKDYTVKDDDSIIRLFGDYLKD